ncbi:hypothetical protein CVIRNUC_006044 [Coccomyxa viridis]|uniref:Nuclear pore complex protein n=1 Tax=Coccomyxa viridis TaxID=1274662 RepID=A0AAV1I638_9CHLO|nr:hypothetical protein CVIRNUC_006044 [Coccomyxa viridis]
MASGSALRLLLKHARETVDECLPSNVSREDLNNHTLDGKLSEVLFAVSSAGHGSSKSIDLSWEDKADIWHVVCKLWNSCVDTFSPSSQCPRWMVTLRQHASDILELVKDSELSSEERAVKLSIYHRTGVAHAEAGGYEAAEAAFSRAHEQCMRLMKDLENAGISESQLCELSTSSVDLLLDRLVNAWKLQQTDLASDLLSQASELTSQARMPSRQRFLMCRQVVITCLNRGQQCLAAKDPDAIELLKQAYKLITEHLALDDDDDSFEMF